MLALSDVKDEIPRIQDEVSAYLLTAPRILRNVCRSTGRDEDGRLCPQCCVRSFCESQAARAGKLGEPD